MRSYVYKMWDVVLDGLYVPMKTKMGNEDLEPKLRSEWSELENEEGASKFQSNQHSSLCVESN